MSANALYDWSSAIRQGGVQMQEQLDELDEMEAHHWLVFSFSVGRMICMCDIPGSEIVK